MSAEWKPPHEDLAPYLRDLPRHIGWKEEPRKLGEIKLSKVPYSAVTGARTTAGEGYSVHPRLWVTLATVITCARLHGFTGVGVVLGLIAGADEVLWGIDLDNCFNADGSLRDWAVPIFAVLRLSYCETSPSGGGIKGFFRSTVDALPAVRKALGMGADKNSRTVVFVKKTETEKGQQVEIYCGGHYFTETGLRYADAAADVVLLDAATLAPIGAALPTEEEAKAPKAGERPPSLDEVAEAVAAIPTDVEIGEDDPRKVWLHIGMGLHHASGGSEAGLAIWREFSMRSPEYDEAGLAKAWGGFKVDPGRKPITAGTIFTYAKAFGWERTSRVPHDAGGAFAGMTLDEVIADTCLIVEADRWWSHKHHLAMAANALNTAVSGLRLPDLPWLTLDAQPKTFIGWLKAKNLVRSYVHVVHRGGQGAVCESATGKGDLAVNAWRPPPAIPEEIMAQVVREGEKAITQWLVLLFEVFNHDRALIENMLDWGAMLVWEPSIKPGYHWILRSKTQGNGKDMVADGLCRALGPDNYIVIQRDALESTFNDFIEKRLVIVSELGMTTRGTLNKRDIYNVTQSYTGDRPDRLSVNPKNQPRRSVDNLSGWMILTNQNAPLALPKGDRRWSVAAGQEAIADRAFYASVSDWLKQPASAHLLRAYFKLRWEAMSDERRAALRFHAPGTEAKQHMVDAGMDPTTAYVRSVIDGSYGMGRTWPDLIAPSDIIMHLAAAKSIDALPRNAWVPNVYTAGTWLVENFGAVQVPIGENGKPYQLRLAHNDGKMRQVRLYAIRSQVLYRQMAPEVLKERYTTGATTGEEVEVGEAPAIGQILGAWGAASVPNEAAST